jgi:hypothetical protein
LNLGLAQAQTPTAPQKDARPGESSKTEAPAKTTPAQTPLPADPEERFKFLFTKSFLSGRWAPLRDGVLGEERGGDKYNIVSAVKGDGDNWVINARMKYGEREVAGGVNRDRRYYQPSVGW